MARYKIHLSVLVGLLHEMCGRRVKLTPPAHGAWGPPALGSTDWRACAQHTWEGHSSDEFQFLHDSI